MRLPELGVGVTYSSQLEPLLSSRPGLVDVIEIEPQTFWLEGVTGQRYGSLDGVVGSIAALPCRKVVHSVGCPVGGSTRPDPHQLARLRQDVEALHSPWMSDHLSFNAARDFHTGFFLPPLQTSEGVKNAVASIRDMQKACGVPVAIETGVNYLRPRNDEIPDGCFLSEIVRQSDCGILLDLHNLHCNQINGRQSIDAFLSQIPLDRVWEVHLAGGMEMNGYWLDAHSGAIPERLVAKCYEVLPRLTNLKALIFEIFPSFIDQFGLDNVAVQLEKLRDLWEVRGCDNSSAVDIPIIETELYRSARISCEEWESALGSLVIGRSATDALSEDLNGDPGVHLVRQLVREFRGSMIVKVFRLTSRLLMLTLGADGFMVLLNDFWSKNTPKQFALTEAERFANYLFDLNISVPHLAKVLEFEQATIASLLSKETRVVKFDFDPVPLLRALADGRLPEIVGATGKYEIALTPDDNIFVDWPQPHSGQS